MRNTANKSHISLTSLRRLHQSALLAGVVLSAIFTIFPAQAQVATLSQPENPENTVDFTPNADTLNYDANGRIIDEPDLIPANPALSAPDSHNPAQPIGQIDSGRAMPVARENLRETASHGRGIAPATANPFEAQGIRAGSFILRPSLDQGIRTTNNADNSANGSSATLSETTLRLNAQSDWTRHQATINATGSFEKNLSGEHVSNPRGQIDAALRLDLSEQTRVNLGMGYRVNREDAADPNGVGIARTRPLVHNTTAEAGIERDIGKIFANAIARVNHTSYGKATLLDGARLDQSYRNNTYVSMTLRGGFEVSAVIKPFAEIELGRRLYKNSDGLNRDADQYALRAGLQIDRGEKFNGEFAVGYIASRSEDHNFSNVSGLSIESAMNWSPQRGTDIQFGLRTYLDRSPDLGGDSSLLYLANINVTRMIRANLSLNARLDASIRDNHDGSGTDYGMGAEIGATYWFNRFFGVDARLRHEFINSDVASRKYSSNSIYMGVKLQR